MNDALVVTCLKRTILDILSAVTACRGTDESMENGPIGRRFGENSCACDDHHWDKAQIGKFVLSTGSPFLLKTLAFSLTN